MSDNNRLTLADIMALLRKADDDPDAIDGLDLGELTKDKIESYHEIIEVFRADALSLKTRAKEFAELSKVQERKADRIEERLKREMRANNFEKLPGHNFSAVLGKRKTLVIHKQPDVTERLEYPEFVDLDLKWREPPKPIDLLDFGDRIEVTYLWNKTALRNALKSTTAPSALDPFVRYEDEETFKWQVRREV